MIIKAGDILRLNNTNYFYLIIEVLPKDIFRKGSYTKAIYISIFDGHMQTKQLGTFFHDSYTKMNTP